MIGAAFDLLPRSCFPAMRSILLCSCLVAATTLTGCEKPPATPAPAPSQAPPATAKATPQPEAPPAKPAAPPAKPDVAEDVAALESLQCVLTKDAAGNVVK